MPAKAHARGLLPALKIIRHPGHQLSFFFGAMIATLTCKMIAAVEFSDAGSAQSQPNRLIGIFMPVQSVSAMSHRETIGVLGSVIDHFEWFFGVIGFVQNRASLHMVVSMVKVHKIIVLAAIVLDEA